MEARRRLALSHPVREAEPLSDSPAPRGRANPDPFPLTRLEEVEEAPSVPEGPAWVVWLERLTCVAVGLVTSLAASLVLVALLFFLAGAALALWFLFC
jgi:hypothetical protein